MTDLSCLQTKAADVLASSAWLRLHWSPVIDLIEEQSYFSKFWLHIYCLNDLVPFGDQLTMTGRRGGRFADATTGRPSDSKQVHEVTWNQQGSRVLEQLRSLYGDRGEGLGVDTDVILWGSDGECVEAHKMVLGLCSPYFQRLFAQINQTKCQKGRDGPTVVVLKSVSSLLLKHLVQFIYTGTVAVPSENMQEFLEIGNEFQIEGITYSSSTGKTDNAHHGQQQQQNIMVSSQKPSQVIQPSTPGKDTIEMATEESDVSFDSYPVKVEMGSVDFVDEGANEDEQEFGVESEDAEHSSEEEEGDEAPSRKRPKRQATSSSQAKYPESRRHEWVIQEPVSQETLHNCWRVKCSGQTGGCPFTEYHCTLGGCGPNKCRAKIKIKTLNDGTVVWMNNSCPHTRHGKNARVWGLTSQQKQFAMQCIQDKVFQPDDIEIKFQLEGLPLPPKAKLRKWLVYYRKTHPERFQGYVSRYGAYPYGNNPSSSNSSSSSRRTKTATQENVEGDSFMENLFHNGHDPLEDGDQQQTGHWGNFPY